MYFSNFSDGKMLVPLIRLAALVNLFINFIYCATLESCKTVYTHLLHLSAYMSACICICVDSFISMCVKI